MDQKNSTIISVFIAIFIILMLILSGPAQAVQILLNGIQSQYQPGSFVNFTVSINISNPEKYVPAKNMDLKINGPVNLDSAFYLNGTLISSASNIKINPVKVPENVDYGYGYGQNDKTLVLKYNVSINTTSLPLGNYTASAKFISGKAINPSFDSDLTKFELLQD
jgi:hypothetical protein